MADGFNGSTAGLIVDIPGSIEDSNAVTYTVWYGVGGNPVAWEIIGETHVSPSPRPSPPGGEGVIARWCAAEKERGLYTVKVVATDESGNGSEARATVLAGGTLPTSGGIVERNLMNLTDRGPGYGAPAGNGRDRWLVEPAELVLAAPATLTVGYREEQAAGVEETSLLLARYDDERGRWEPAATMVDPINHTASAEVRALGYYILTTPPPADIISPISSPRIKDIWEFEGYLPATAPETGLVIATPTGEPVATMYAAATGGAEMIVFLKTWDGTNDSGLAVPDGEYHLLFDGVETATVRVDNTPPTIRDLAVAVDGVGLLILSGAINDQNLDRYTVILDGDYAGEEKLLTTRYAGIAGTIATVNIAELPGKRIIVNASDHAGNETSVTVALPETASLQRLWCDQGWIAPEVESPDLPHSATFTYGLGEGVTGASLRIENETGLQAIVRENLGPGDGSADWHGDNGGQPLAAGNYTYRIDGVTTDSLYYIQALNAAELDLDDYLKTVGGDGDYRIVGNRVAHLDQSGSIDRYLTAAADYQTLKDVAVDGDGNLWVLDAARCQVDKLDTGGTRILSAGRYGVGAGEYIAPAAIAAEGTTLYVLDGATGRLDGRDRIGRLLSSTYSAPGSDRLGFAGGKVYIHDPGDGAVLEYGRAGGRIEIRDLIAKITLPMADAMVRANVPVFGMACGKEFLDYQVEYGQGRYPDTWVTIEWSAIPQNDDIEPRELFVGDRTIEGNLTTWATGLTEYDYSQFDPRCVDQGIEGLYTLRLTARNQAGKTAEDRATVTVGKVMSNTYEGTVISDDGKVVVIVPEQALKTEFLVMSIGDAGIEPAPLEGGRQLGRVYEFQPAGTQFTRPALTQWTVTVEMLDGDSDGIAELDTSAIRIYHYDAGAKRWDCIGGVWNAGLGVVEAEINEIIGGRGYYALWIDAAIPAAPVLQATSSPTEQEKIIVEGTAEPGLTVEIWKNGVQAARTRSSNQGGFWCEIGLATGDNALYAIAEDGAGNRSVPSNTISIIRQTIDPSSVTGLTLLTDGFTPLTGTEASAGDRIGIELTGADADNSARNRTAIELVMGSHRETIDLLETETSSGVYRAVWRVPVPETELAQGTAITFTATADPSVQATLTWKDQTPPRIESVTVGNEPLLAERSDTNALVAWSVGSGITAELVDRSQDGGDRAIRFTNTAGGGAFRIDRLGLPFEFNAHQLLSFDYRMAPETQLNLLVKAGGRWYDLRLTDTRKDKYFDVNMELLSDLEGVADGQWHTATVDLGELLAPRTSAREIEAICFADWDVNGFMKLIPGNANGSGAWLEVDNLIVSGAVQLPATITVQARDESGLNRIGYQVVSNIGEPISDTVWQSPGTVFQYDGPMFELPATVMAYAEDNCGNLGVEALPVFLDNSPPETTSITVMPKSITPHQTLKLDLWDLGSGVDPSSIQVAINGATYDLASGRVAFSSGKLAISFSGLSFTPGETVTVAITGITDRAGNAPGNLPWEWDFSWHEERVLISEVNIAGDDYGNDYGSWIELYCASGPADVSWSYLEDLERRALGGIAISESPLTLNTGDYLVVRLGSGIEESDNPDGSGWTDVNGNGLREVYLDNCLVLNRQGDQLAYTIDYIPGDGIDDRTLADGVVWKYGMGRYLESFESLDVIRLIMRGGWAKDEAESYNDSVIDLQGKGHIVRRDPNIDTDRKGDWVVTDAESPGAENRIEADLVPPAIPAHLAAVGGERQILLTWDAVTDSDLMGYELYRGDVAGPLGLVATTDYTDPGVTPGQEYRYQIAAVDRSGNRSRTSGSVGATAMAATWPPELIPPNPARVATATLPLRGLATGSGPIVVQSAAGGSYLTNYAPAREEVVISASELVNVAGCELVRKEYETIEGVRTVTYYTLKSIPELWFSSPFGRTRNGLYFWEQVDGSPKDWTQAAAGGILTDAGDCRFVKPEVGLDDYTVRFRVRPLAGEPAFWFAAANDNGYRLRFQPENQAVVLEKVVAGEVTPLGECGTSAAGEWSEYAVARKGSQIVIVENGATTLAVDDPAGVPWWCKGLAIDNRGSDMEYDYVGVYRGDLFGVLSTAELPREQVGKVMSARVDGTVPGGAVAFEVQDGVAPPRALTAETGGCTIAASTYRIWTTIWQGNEADPAPVVRGVHLDVQNRFGATVALELGANTFTAGLPTGEVSNPVVVERVSGPKLEVTEISNEGTLISGYLEVLNAGSESVALSALSIGNGLTEIHRMVGEPGYLAVGERALCRLGDPLVQTENEATGDLNENGFRDLAFEDQLDLAAQGTIILFWDGLMLDAVPMTDPSRRGEPELNPELMATLNDQGQWNGDRVEMAVEKPGRCALTRLEWTPGNQPGDWITARPTPGRENSPFPIPRSGDVVINKVYLGDTLPWAELLVLQPGRDVGALWLDDLDGNEIGPLSGEPLTPAAGEKLFIQLPYEAFASIEDQARIFVGRADVDGVSWRESSTDVAEEAADHSTLVNEHRLWQGDPIVYGRLYFPLVRDPEGNDNDVAADWRTSTTGPGWSDTVPPTIFEASVTPAVFDPYGIAGPPACTIRYGLDDNYEVVILNSIEVLNAAGERVRGIVSNYERPSGYYQYEWNGRNDQGVIVPEGEYPVRISAREGPGNSAELSVSVRVEYEKVAPEAWLELGGSHQEPFVGPNTEIRVNGQDNSQLPLRFSYQINGGEWLEQPVGEGFALPAGDGLLTIGYYAIDVAGNRSPTGSASCTYDGIAPAVSAGLDEANRLILTADDGNGAGIEGLLFSHIGQGMIPYTGPVSFYGAGVYAVRYSVTDKVGNQRGDSLVVRVPATVPAPRLELLPELTNLANLPVTGSAVSEQQVEIQTNGVVRATVAASRREVEIPLSAFGNRDNGVVEENGYLTLQRYQELWADDFADGDLAPWQALTGVWEEKNGELFGKAQSVAIIERPDWIDAAGYSMTGRFKPAFTNQRVAIGFRVSGERMYTLDLQYGRLTLNRNNEIGQSWQLGPTVDCSPFQAGNWYTFRIDCSPDGQLRGTVGDYSVAASDNQYHDGSTRLTMGDYWWQGMSFDDIRAFIGGATAGSATTGELDLTSFGELASVAVAVIPGDGGVDVSYSENRSDTRPLYSLIGNVIPSGAALLSLEFTMPDPQSESPRCGPITLRGWGDYSVTVPLTEGENRLVAYAEDGAGNRSGPSEERVVILDTHKPAIAGLTVTPAVFSPDGNGVDDQTEINFTFADNLTGYVGTLMVIVKDGADDVIRTLLNPGPAVYGGRTVVWDGRNDAGDNMPTGTYVVEVLGADAAGNQARAEAPVDIRTTFDVAPPEIAVTVPVDNASYSYTLPLTLAWTISDTESGVASSSATLDGAPANSGQTIDLKALGIGGHTLTVTATDNAGNAATVSVGFTVVDDVPPTITLTQPATPTNQDVSLQYVAYDEITPTPTVTGDQSPYTAEGVYTVTLTATDQVGNQATSNAVTFTTDKTAPATTLTVGVPNYNDFITSATPLTLAATNNLTAFTTYYRLDNGTWQEYAGAFTLTGDGAHTVGYRSEDAAGNVESEQTRTLTVDNTPPASTLAADLLSADGAVAVPETKITLTVTDASAGVEKIEYQVNSGVWVTYSAPFELRDVAGLGPVTIWYRAVDRLGNVEAERIASYTVKPALELEAGLLTSPRVLCWWNSSHEGEGRDVGEEDNGPSREEWTAALTAAFDSAALDYLIVETPAEFLARLTDYNVYLIIGDEKKLDEAEEGEGEDEENLGDSLVAAQVALGKTLISFGYEDLKTPEDDDRGWENVFGIKVDGVLNGTAHLAVYPTLTSETTTLTIEGKNERIKEILSGEVWGEVALIERGEHGDDEHGDRRHGGRGEGDGDEHGEGDDEHNDTWSAIVANSWGSGKVLFLAPDYRRNLTALSDVLKNAILWGAPAREVVQAGGVVGIKINVINAVLPITLRVYVEASLPVESDAVAVYDNGTEQGNAVIWTGDLAAGVTGNYRFLLRLPLQPGPYTVTVYGYYSKELGYRLVDTYELVLP